jgi:hypothetical protein
MHTSSQAEALNNNGMIEEARIPPKHRAWNLETTLMGLMGLAMVFTRDHIHQAGVVGETIILIILLGGLMGITRIPFPTFVMGRKIPLWGYPILSGILSMFMDSFLVLIMVGSATIIGPANDQFKFRVYNMIAALIGGLGMYFGEAYMIPLALKYGMRHWYSMLPILTPVLAYLFVLAILCGSLNVQVGKIAELGGPHQQRSTYRDHFEFATFVALLLVFHNPLLVLGLLFLWASVTGQGEDLINVIKTETEVNVMQLLVIALLIAQPMSSVIAEYASGWWAFIPATINGVLMGAIYPAQGNVWREVTILSSAVLITPISSLVGVMLFKTWNDWKKYMRVSIPLATVWFVICLSWFMFVWPVLEPSFHSVFPRPALTTEASSNSH